MVFLILIILGVIQGVCEFLPISSSGHLVLAYKIFGIYDNTLLLSIILHIATLLAVLIFYRKELLVLMKNPFCPTNKKIFITTIVTCIVALILKPFIDNSFSGDYIGIFFSITALLIIVGDYFSKANLPIPQDITRLPITYKQAVIIGLAQGVACFPGLSRSGTTIAVAQITGVQDPAKYSFLISIPIIIASLVLEIFSGETLGNINILGIIMSFVVCFVIGLVCIKAMVNFVRKNKLIYFSYYLIILSVFLLLNDLFFQLF